jgi:hypothetical protein
MIKSYKDYLTEAEQAMVPQPGDCLHFITEDGVEHIQLERDSAVDKLADAAGIKKYGKKAWGWIKKTLGIGGGVGAGAGAGLLGGALLGGGGGGSGAFKAGYDLASNQFVGDNPLIETLNKQVHTEYPQNISHFIIDLR